jgi:hypothetical protein
MVQASFLTPALLISGTGEAYSEEGRNEQLQEEQSLAIEILSFADWEYPVFLDVRHAEKAHNSPRTLVHSCYRQREDSE